ncbi:MAG TPA: pantetheine-phosphate adenylyltransferase [Bryobacteraceae bacterium]|jgi:pantetheine-phosphate adenylyltransferase|nr:pantetheine-phosphate adenylyltransferase [Bryobacteraceae bacterium]
MPNGDHQTIAIYPGSFDPPTNGHLDLIARASRLFDSLIVAVLQNTSKQPLFAVEERINMLHEAAQAYGNVAVESFGGLLVDFAQNKQATAIVRGIRAVSDYEVELQMAHLNRQLRPATETVFLPATAEFAFLSSRMIKEIIQLGGDVKQFVPEPVWRRLQSKLQ